LIQSANSIGFSPINFHNMPPRDLQSRDLKSKDAQPKEDAAQFEPNVTTDPKYLLIKPPFNQAQFLNLRITNVGPKLCMFKLMASHPKLYKIKNRVGILKPAETIISVIKLDGCGESVLTGNKIVVQTTLVDKEPINKEDYWKTIDEGRDTIQSTRIKIVTKEELAEEKQNKTKNSIMGTPTMMKSPAEPSRIRTVPIKEIVFNGPFTQVSTTAFTIYNVTERFIYFRFLITSDIFRIRPQFAVIDPSKNKLFAVILKNLSSEEEKKATKEKHGLRIDYMEADSSVEDPMSMWEKGGQKVSSQKMDIYVKS